MRRLLWLGAMFGVFLLSSCGSSEKKVSPQDVIGDEEYRVMSAVLKDRQMDWHNRVFCPAVPVPLGTSSEKFDSIMAAEGAKVDSLHRIYGRLALRVYRDSIRTREFYDTLMMEFGKMAYYIVRDSVNGRTAYDSLHRKFGNLDYYIVLADSTAGDTADGYVLRSKELKGLATPELLISYNENNHQTFELRRERFKDSLVVEFMTAGDIDTALATGEWWPAFFARFPLSDEAYSVSRVGFNSDSTAALVNVGVQIRRFRVSGLFTVLQKSDGRWVVMAKEMPPEM